VQHSWKLTYSEKICPTIALFVLFGYPLTGCRGPQGCETSTLPHFLNNRLTDGGEGTALRSGRPLPPRPPGRFEALISVRVEVDTRAIVLLEGLGQLKNPIISSGIEPAIFSSVAKCLNQLPYRVPHSATLPHHKFNMT
jgi:hypothetical protein